MNTADYLVQAASDHQVAIITQKKQYSYWDLKERSAAIAQEFLAKGIRPTDRVGLLGANSFFWVAAYLAALKLGAATVPLPATLTPSELRVRQELIGCKLVCSDKRTYRRLQAGLPHDLPVIFEDSVNRANTVSWAAIPTHDDVHQDALLLFTSGTTARPRVVRLTHGNIQANTNSIVNYLALTSADRVMAILPFSYCFGGSLLHSHLRVGGSLVLSRFLYPEVMLDLLEDTACTGLAGVPSVYQKLLRNTTFPNRKLKSLRKVQQAGGKLPNILINELSAAIPNADIYIMYGQTEATARLSYLPPQFLETKLGSIGRGIPDVTLQVVDKWGVEIKPGEVGEIVAKGANISPGYLDNPEATAQKFVNGALYTGDLATVDADGFIYIVDRKTDFIKSYGHRVSSYEIEACVLELSQVVTAAAVGVPDLVRGEVIKVYVTLRANTHLNPEEIIGHCKQRMASHAIPHEVIVLKNLPMNANGKVQKSVLRQNAMERGDLEYRVEMKA